MKFLTLTALLFFALNSYSQNGDNIDCKKVPMDTVITDNNLEFKTAETANLWEKCEVLDGGLLTTIPRGASVRLIKRRFDWWNVEFEGKTGWVLEEKLRMPKCVYWLNNVGSKVK